jgi:hypothetical protein
MNTIQTTTTCDYADAHHPGRPCQHAVALTPEVGERVAILWLASDGATDGDTIDSATVVETDAYTMKVRIGWQGSTPLLMLFRNMVREQIESGGLVADVDTLPLVRESAGIPLNYRD